MTLAPILLTSALSCYPRQPTPGTPAPAGTQPSAQTRPTPHYLLADDRDAVESFFAAIAAGDMAALNSMVTSDHPNGIGGRTWEEWIRDFRDAHITQLPFHITDHHFLGDQTALGVVLSNNQIFTFYFARAGKEVRITRIDPRTSVTTQP